MLLSQNNVICRCFLTENYFIKSLDIHVRFDDRDTFLSDYQTYLSENCSTEEISQILEMLEKEKQRRQGLRIAAAKRHKEILRKYRPLHPHVYQLREEHLQPELIELVNQCKSDCGSILQKLRPVKGNERVYQIPLFTHQFCRDLHEELVHFEESDLPKGRPNTMNNYGVNVQELGFDEHLLTPLRERYLGPLSAVLFPDCGGATLDSQRAFTVSYGPTADCDLDLHFDNAEVTANVSIFIDSDGTSDAGGDLFFGGMRTEQLPVGTHATYARCRHRLGHALLHRAQQVHGALPMADGTSRRNLIIWMRSSAERNKLCPMCDKLPDLVELAEGVGDGFSIMKEIAVCALN